MIVRAVVGVLGVWDVRTVRELKGKSWLEMQYEDCVCLSFVVWRIAFLILRSLNEWHLVF